MSVFSSWWSHWAVTVLVLAVRVADQMKLKLKCRVTSDHQATLFTLVMYHVISLHDPYKDETRRREFPNTLSERITLESSRVTT